MRFSLPLGGGLHTTLAVGAAPQNSARTLWNATEERGILEARPGFGLLQLLGSYGDEIEIYGMGFAQSGEHREFSIVCKFAGDTKSSLVVLDESATWPLAQASYGDDSLDNSTWLFQAWGEYLYAANETDGLWRRKVGETSGDLVWQRVNTRYKYNVLGSVSLVEYSTRLWATATETSNAFAPESYSPGTHTINAGGTWTLEQTVGAGSAMDSYAFWVCTFGANVDFSTHRYLTLQITLEYDPADVRPWENPVFTPGVPSLTPICWLSTSAAAALPAGSAIRNAWSGWSKAVVWEDLLDRDRLLITIDLDAAAKAGLDLDSVRRFALGVNLRAGNVYKAHLSAAQLGGTWLSKPRATELMTVDPESTHGREMEPIEYAIQYYKSATGAESSATILTLAEEDTYGLTAGSSLIPCGAIAEITYEEGTGANAPANFDKIRIWRKRWSDSAQWWLIAEVTNADGTLEDARVDAIADPVAWVSGTPTKRTSANDFTTVDQSLSPQAIAAWKGHLVLGVGREVYISYGGNPELYVPPARDNPQVFDSDDPTLGRTLYMSQDASDECIGAVADDQLYLIGKRGVYVMYGDTALTATPPRLLKGSRGAYGVRAFCKWNGGVLCASDEGLLWHRGTRALAYGSDSIYEFEDLTAEIKDTWRRFTTNATRVPLMLVREWRGEIYVVLDNKFLRRNRSGKWEEGAWNASALSGGTAGAGGAEFDDDGYPFVDDPGTGDAWPAGPYQDPNTLPSSSVGNPIHGITDRWWDGIWFPPYDYRPGESSLGWLTGEAQMGGSVLGPESEPDGRIVEMLPVEGVGLRAISYSGGFAQMSYGPRGVNYLTDNGFPICWMRQSQAFDFGRETWSDLYAVHSEQKANSQTLRVILTTSDGRVGLDQVYYDLDDELHPDLRRLKPGNRAFVIVAGRSASRRLEQLDIEVTGKRSKGT